MRASQLIEAAESAGEIVNNCLQKPANEAQARPLAKLPKEQRAEIAAATRWCEIRIGELLGKAEPKAGPGRGKETVAREQPFSAGSKYDHHKFRLLAERRFLFKRLPKAGELLAAMDLHGSNQHGRKSHDVTSSLSDLGISKMQSHR
jgi:hypothetical protein